MKPFIRNTILRTRTNIYWSIVKIGKASFRVFPLTPRMKYRIKSAVDLILRSNELLLTSDFAPIETYRYETNHSRIKSNNVILIDCQPLKNQTFYRGIGRYTLALSKKLAQRNPDVDFVLLVTNIGSIGNTESLKNTIESWNLANVSFLLADVMSGRKTIIRAEALIKLQKIFEDLNPHRILIPSNFEHPQDSLYIDAVYFKNVSIIIHDLIPLHYKDDLLPSETLLSQYLDRLKKSTDAQYIITNSNFTARDYIRTTGHSRNILPIGGAGYYSSSRTTIGDYHSRSGILCVGAETPHKNIQGLLDAYQLIAPDIRKRHPLVLVGIPESELKRRLIMFATKKKLNVQLQPFLTDSDLGKLYEKASVVVVPSFIEGLAMPIFESWAFGTPVLASRGTVMQEVIQNESMLFEPMDSLDIARSIEGILVNPSIWREEQNRILSHRNEYSWDKVVEKLDAWVK